MIYIDYKNRYNKYLDLFNDYSEKVFYTVQTDSKLSDAMKYSFFAGGKRIRPVLTIAFYEILGGKIEEALPFAFALECIHTYSLIHDDLPALDNDVLRRGKPTCHVEFDESTAILAGDALLNFAFEHVLSNINNHKQINALKILANLSGHEGMLGGQQIDIESEGLEIDENKLFTIHDLKTCKLLSAPFMIASAILDESKMQSAKEFGKYAGLLFQFTDDVLDVLSSQEKLGKSIGKDQSADKLTSVKVYGLDGVREKIDEFSFKAQNIAKSLDNSGFLQCFIQEITGRINEN